MQSNFQDKKYFFMFKDGATWGTESLTGSEKREWLGYLKIYYYQTKSISIKKWSVNIICFDFGLIPGITKVNQWM